MFRGLALKMPSLEHSVAAALQDMVQQAAANGVCCGHHIGERTQGSCPPGLAVSELTARLQG
eukprot:CAMPEP_0117667390 /NCGR_PEP_ID=MMETSP0804-20121206/10936_1 /TAXON_ID=1074897 /ORGANISM="Tetraselmis astigmatica, Strain CCMP880" /LENGTH=61 /DNA_ID=CAMNT_0005475103 /DNA_START=843 /DNA_END=1028 /DNA_ORIENTATION=-